MKRCFLVCGPESAGNRLLASLLARAGCIGEGSTTNRWRERLPADETSAVIIRHRPSAAELAELDRRGYIVTALVTTRDLHCTTRSQVARGHCVTETEAWHGIGAAYREIFRALPDNVDIVVAPFEAFTLHREAAANALLARLGLPKLMPGRVAIDNHLEPGIRDENAKWYGRARPGDPAFLDRLDDSLIWLPEHGMGWYPVTEQPYGEEYFDKYRGYAGTEMGEAITAARVAFVDRFFGGAVIDVGIGSGQFLEARAGTTGFDINPAAVAWLNERSAFADPRYAPVPAATFWDSLEHIPDPRQILDNLTEWSFVSLPIFRGPEHVLASKHYRRDEHCWYFTRDGFVAWMASHGWRIAGQSDMESSLGREDILTFAFQRAEQPWLAEHWHDDRLLAAE